MNTKNAILAGLVALAVTGCTSGSSSHPANSPTPEDPMMFRSASGSGELSKSMRQLWAEHAVWTRLYIIAAVSDQPDAWAASERLLRNQKQIGKAIVPYYGEVSGDQLAALLKAHILIAVDVVKAAKEADPVRLTAANLRWHENVEELANFLANRNPNWRREEMVTMLSEHLELTTSQVTARLAKDWDGDVKSFDLIFEQALKMADMMSEGIVKQFPNLFRS